VREREADRQALLRAIGDSGTPQLRAHRYLACSAARLVAVQIEDVIGTVEPVNVPGTHGEYPNWRRKLDRDLNEIFDSQETLKLLAAVNAARQGMPG
jgi:4-alpha-glucanotransferase